MRISTRKCFHYTLSLMLCSIKLKVMITNLTQLEKEHASVFLIQNASVILLIVLRLIRRTIDHIF